MSFGNWVLPQEGKVRRSEARLGRVEEERGPGWGKVVLERVRSFWSRRGRLIVDLALMGLLSWCLAGIFLSARFFVYGVESSGNVYIPARDIFQASHVDDMSVFYLRPAEIEQTVEGLPNIKGARVRVALPARVFVEVEEYTPVAIWQTGQAEFWVSEEGELLPMLAKIPELIRLVDTDAVAVNEGDFLSKELLAMLSRLGDLHSGVGLLQFSRAKGLSFVAGDGTRVFLGLDEGLEEKLRDLAGLRAYFQTRGLEADYIDLSVPGRLYYKPAAVVTATVTIAPGR